MMKILHIITRLDKGGSAEVALSLAEGHKKMGHNVFIAAGSSADSQVNMRHFSKETDIKIIDIPYLRRNVNPLLDIPAFFQTFSVIKKIKPDVLHTHTSKAGFIGRIAGKAADIKAVVHTPHGHIFYGYYNSHISRIFIYLEHIAARFSDRITTLTEIERQDYIRENIAAPDKIVSIPCGIEIDRFLSETPETIRDEFQISMDSPVIGWVGRLEPVKGCDIFLQACSLIKEEMNSAVFLVVGEGSLRDDMKKLSSSLGLDKNLFFLGFRNDIPIIMNSIDLLLHTPLNEGLGRVILEAMAKSRPVVASAAGGIPEVVEHGVTGYLAPPGDYIAMAGESVKILKNKELKKNLGRAGKTRALDFSIEKMIEKTHKLYLELLGAAQTCRQE